MWTILISPSFMYLATWFTYNDMIDILTDHQDITLQVVVVPPPFALPHLGCGGASSFCSTSSSVSLSSTMHLGTPS